MHTENLEVGYLARPARGTHPGVLMLHDVWGLSEHTRDQARRLAEAGFSVLALDLYRRDPVEITDPGSHMRGLSDPQVLADVQAGVEVLAERSETEGRRVGVVGFCMGGMYALMAACCCRGVAAAVPFYGLLSHEHGILFDESGLDPAKKPRAPLDYVRDLACPLLACFGDQDEFIPLPDVRALEARLGATSRDTEVVVYEGAGHAFMNDTRAAAFHPEAAADAWHRATRFLASNLG